VVVRRKSVSIVLVLSKSFFCDDECSCKPVEDGGFCSNRAPKEVSKKAKLSPDSY